MQLQVQSISGTIIKAENLGIKKFEIADIVKKEYCLDKVFLHNDAKCAALCEKRIGNLKPYDDAIFLCLGTGIGGAAFLNRGITENKEIICF